MTFQPFDWYQNARLYDIIFDEDTGPEADFLEAVHARHGGTDGRAMLEPACGSGRLVAEMARRGYRVTGFDASPEMLGFARRRLGRTGRRARLLEARMESFELASSFDVAHCLVSSFKYLPDERSARAHLRAVARVLKPGGLYILGLHVTDYAERCRTRERWVGRGDGVDVVCNIQCWPPDRRTRTEQLRARFVVTGAGDGEERYETHWTFRTYSVRQLHELLRVVPSLELVANYHFGLDMDDPVPLDGRRLDNVLVLRRHRREG